MKLNEMPVSLIFNLEEVVTACNFIQNYCENDDELDATKEVEDFKKEHIQRLVEEYGIEFKADIKKYLNYEK